MDAAKQNDVRRRSLVKEAIFWNVLILAVAVFGLGYFFYQNHRSSSEDQHRLRAVSLARFLAAELELPLLVGDYAEVRRIAESSLTADEVVYVRISGHDGDIVNAALGGELSEQARSTLARPTDDVAARNLEVAVSGRQYEVVDVVSSVPPQGTETILDWEDEGTQLPRLGTIQLGFSLKQHQERLEYTARIALAAVLGGLVLVVVLQLTKFRLLLAPLKRLTEFTRRVGAGELDERAAEASHEEIHQLTQAFNGMLDSLAVSRALVRESEERYARAVRGANDGIWDWNLQTQQCHFSARWKSMLGYDEEEIGDTPEEWFGRILEEDRETTRVAVDKHIQGESDQLEIEYRIQHRDGGYRWFLTRGLVVVDGKETPLRVAGSQTDITRRKQAEAELNAMHARLLESSRKAGMADIATSVLHNIGNVLNSVNVSADLVAESISTSKVPQLKRAVSMMQDHEQDIGEFLTEDEKGRHLPGYLAKLAQHLEREQNVNREEVRSLGKSIEHIKAIVQMQQSYARATGVLEPMQMADLVEDAIRLNEAGLTRHHVVVEREYSAVPPVMIDRHKSLQILVNLISNAKYAMDHLDVAERLVRIRISSPSEDRVQVTIIDSGVGIAKDDLGKIFQHGFTTRKDGHGFGLHSSALAAKELQGSLVGESDGPGCGATFTLELPLTRKVVPA